MAHGGDRYRNRVEYDFSVNVNPLGMPEILRAALLDSVSEAGFYPDPQQEAARRGAADFYGGRAGINLLPDHVIPGNGASELIMAVMQALRPKKVVLPTPCFTGYVRAVKSVGAEVVSEILQDTELVILVNPSNPTGEMLDSNLLQNILVQAKELDIPVLVDECFLEFTGRESESGLLLQEEYPKLLVLRAFTKIFAMPGVRMGCLLCRNAELGRKIRDALPEWNLSSFAQAVLMAAGEHRQELYRFMDETVGETKRLRDRMTEKLQSLAAEKGMELSITPSETNYLLTTGWGIRGSVLRDHLLTEGILLRCCGDMPPLTDDHIRLAVRTEREQDILLEALSGPLSFFSKKIPSSQGVDATKAYGR